MQSTPTPDEADPHDIFAIEPDVVLATRAEQPAVANPPAAQASQDKPQASRTQDIMGDILSRPSTPKGRVAPDISVAVPAPPTMPPVDTTFRATAATADIIAGDIKASHAAHTPDAIQVPSDIRLDGAPSSAGRWAKRAAVAFLFALGSVAAAEGWDHYGDTATQMTRQMMADWAPQLALNSSQQPSEKLSPAKAAPENTVASAPPVTTAPPAEPAVPAVIADQTASPPAPSAIQPAAEAPATTAAAPSQPAQAQPTSPDITAMGQQIEALKATIAQLKAGQEQMAAQISSQQASHDTIRNAVARTSEGRISDARAAEARMSEPHARLSSTSPRPAPVRKPPRPAYSSAQASAALTRSPQPAPPLPPPPVAATSMQAQPQMQVVTEDGDLVVRPPMPVR
jgi:hypothetical protein